jgi:excinuclease ABC subunit B
MFRSDYRRKAIGQYGPACPDAWTWPAALRGVGRHATADHTSRPPGRLGAGPTGGAFVEQVIRPTGLIDPPVEVRPAKSQVDDLIDEVRQVARAGYRALVTTLTKRMAEDLTEYMHEQGIRVRYMHSDIETLERIEIIRDLRLGAYDVLIGINLLREGLDIPECAGGVSTPTRKASCAARLAWCRPSPRRRSLDGKVILYADQMTGSIRRVAEAIRRREADCLERRQRHHARASEGPSDVLSPSTTGPRDRGPGAADTAKR